MYLVKFLVLNYRSCKCIRIGFRSNAITNNMFFVGIQDIEDSITSEVWVNICNERLKEWEIRVSSDEVENIKKTIPFDRFANKS